MKRDVKPQRRPARFVGGGLGSNGFVWRDEPSSSMRKVIARRLSESSGRRRISTSLSTATFAECSACAARSIGSGIATSFRSMISSSRGGGGARQSAGGERAFVETAIRYIDDVDVAVAVATDAVLLPRAPPRRSERHRHISAEMRDRRAAPAQAG